MDENHETVYLIILGGKYVERSGGIVLLSFDIVKYLVDYFEY